MSTKINVRKITMTSLLGAMSTVLMVFGEFKVPFMPEFIQMDFSELPALIAAFSMGPLSGIGVCLIKNAVHVFMTITGGIGEIANFLLGVAFVAPAALIYNRLKSRRGALIGSAVGALSMALLSLPINYFITYPMYTRFMPLDAMIESYQQIIPNVDGLLMCLIVFNVPFTLLKGAADAIITFLIYKRISPIIRGK